MLNIPAPQVCIAHAPCTDGWVSALICWLRFGNIEFFPGCYESQDYLNEDLWLSRLEGKDVLIVDFSFPREMTEKLQKVARSLHVIDHHKSAMESLGDLPYCIFDMEKSGALMIWEALFESPPPKLVQYVSDHDLWQHKLPYSHEIAAAIGYKEKDFRIWAPILAQMEGKLSFDALVHEGTAILAMLRSVAQDLSGKALPWQIAGNQVIALNGVSPITNEVCDRLRQLTPGMPVASYEILGSTVKFSLRSLDEIDVKEIAVKFPGGGGHKNSAAFNVPIEHVDWVNREVKP